VRHSLLAVDHMLPYSLLLHTASRVRTVSRGYTRPCDMGGGVRWVDRWVGGGELQALVLVGICDMSLMRKAQVFKASIICCSELSQGAG
jgi:hypothetical protein